MGPTKEVFLSKLERTEYESFCKLKTANDLFLSQIIFLCRHLCHFTHIFSFAFYTSHTRGSKFFTPFLFSHFLS